MHRSLLFPNDKATKGSRAPFHKRCRAYRMFEGESMESVVRVTKATGRGRAKDGRCGQAGWET